MLPTSGNCLSARRVLYWDIEDVQGIVRITCRNADWIYEKALEYIHCNIKKSGRGWQADMVPPRITDLNLSHSLMPELLLLLLFILSLTRGGVHARLVPVWQCFAGGSTTSATS